MVQVLQGDPDDLDDSQDQRAEGQRASVVPRDGPTRLERHNLPQLPATLAGLDAPERAAEGGEEREGRHVVGLLEGPVVGGEGAGQRHLAQRDDEVGEPEEHEDVEELEHDEVFVVGSLATIEREEALGVRAQLGDVAGVERLERTKDTTGQPRAWSETSLSRLILQKLGPKSARDTRQLKRSERPNAPQLRKVEFHREKPVGSRDFSGYKDSRL